MGCGGSGIGEEGDKMRLEVKLEKFTGMAADAPTTDRLGKRYIVVCTFIFLFFPIP